MAAKIHLVTIDPQNSFCKVIPANEQQGSHDGELCVAGAWDDMVRVGNLAKRLGNKIHNWHITLDSHHQHHIAHPVWFKDTSGNHPQPFTGMREEKGTIIGYRYDNNGNQHDVGEFTTTKPGDHNWTVSYLRELSKGNRYPHMVWPFHCLIGTPGHNVIAPLMENILEWERKVHHPTNKVTKGSCPYSEHFSAVRAEVPHPKFANTQLNAEFVTMLAEADEVIVTGEALSHCVANTFMDILRELGDDWAKKCVLLTDCSSNVTGFNDLGNKFVKNMTALGMKTSTSTEYLS